MTPTPTAPRSNVLVGLCAHGVTARGSVHTVNEDAFAVGASSAGAPLMILCDGMGGMGDGDRASAMAVAVLLGALGPEEADPRTQLTEALVRADDVLREELCATRRKRPGSTAVVALVHGGALHLGWVGDSRGYLIRDRQVVTRTRDHRVIEPLIASGALSTAEAKQSPLAHLLSRSLGAREPGGDPVEPELLPPVELREGDVVLLCCDGLWDVVEDDDLAAHCDGRPIDAIAAGLAAAAAQAGATDDMTLVIGRIQAGERGVLGERWAAPPALHPHPAPEEAAPEPEAEDLQRPPFDWAGVGVLVALAAVVIGVGLLAF